MATATRGTAPALDRDDPPTVHLEREPMLIGGKTPAQWNAHFKAMQQREERLVLWTMVAIGTWVFAAIRNGWLP